MGKTVTIRKARFGVRSVTVDGHRFVVGEPVRDVPEDVVKTLRARDDLTLHVAQARKSSDEPDPDPDPDPSED